MANYHYITLSEEEKRELPSLVRFADDAIKYTSKTWDEMEDDDLVIIRGSFVDIADLPQADGDYDYNPNTIGDYFDAQMDTTFQYGVNNLYVSKWEISMKKSDFIYNLTRSFAGAKRGAIFVEPNLWDSQDFIAENPIRYGDLNDLRGLYKGAPDAVVSIEYRLTYTTQYGNVSIPMNFFEGGWERRVQYPSQGAAIPVASDWSGQSLFSSFFGWYPYNRNIGGLYGARYLVTGCVIEETNIPILTQCSEDDFRRFVTADEPDWEMVPEEGRPTDQQPERPMGVKSYYLYETYEVYEEDGYGNKRIVETGVRRIRFNQDTPNKTCLYKTGAAETFDLKLKLDTSVTATRFAWSDGGVYQYGTEPHWYEFSTAGKHYNDKHYVVQTTGFATNIPIFGSLDRANDYENGFADLEDAENADSILGDKPDYFDPVGDEVNSTPLGNGYTSQAFNKVYAVNASNLRTLSGELFNTDTSVLDVIMEGLKLYGANPMDVIIDLNYYPVDVTDLVAHSSQNYIMFGTYKMDIAAGVEAITNVRGQKDFGTVLYPIQNGDFRDFEPFTELYIYLPYIGVKKLDVATYYSKSINLKYIIDFSTGTCTAVLFCNGIISDMFDGMIAVKNPITAIDFAQYAGSVFSSFSNVIGSMVGTVISVAGAGASAIAGVGGAALSAGKAAAAGGSIAGSVGSGLTQAGNAVASSGLGDAFGDAMDFGKAMTNLTQTMNSQHIQIKGSSSPSASLCLPQYPYLITVINETETPNNELQIVGKPSSYGGKLAGLTGYVECESVRLTSNATPAEKAQITSILRSGVYI